MLQVKQVAKANRIVCRNALWLVTLNSELIGSVEKPYHKNEYRAHKINQFESKVWSSHSTKQLAIAALINVVCPICQTPSNDGTFYCETCGKAVPRN